MKTQSTISNSAAREKRASKRAQKKPALDENHNHRDWAGTLLVGKGWLVFSGTSGDTDPHSHLLAQLVVGRNNAAVTVSFPDKLQSANRVFIPSGVEHQLEYSADIVDILYIDPTLSNISRTADDHITQSIANNLFDVTMERQGSDFEIRQLSSSQVDPRVLRAQKFINEHLVEEIPMQKVADITNCSVSRLTVLMRQHTGLTFRQFVRWSRLSRAILSLATTSSFTEAAHMGGFADAAHFSRTMREMFGVSPTEGLRHLNLTSSDLWPGMRNIV